MTFWKRQNYGDIPDWWLPGPEAEPTGLTSKGPKGNFGDDGNVLYLDCGSYMAVCFC